MKVLIDSNVALNKLLQQPEFYKNSNTIFKLAEIGRITGYISASAVTDIYYITGKKLGKTFAIESIKNLLSIYKPATVTDKNIYEALDLGWNDFEDAVQYVAGESLDLDYIITWNTSDFSKGNIPSVTSEQFIEIITDI